MYFLSNCYSCSNKKIPIFSSQLEKSREAVDLANIRAAYAEVMTSALTEDKSTDSVDVSTDGKTYSKEVTLTQTVDGWTTDVTEVKIGEVSLKDTTPVAKGTATVSYNGTNATVTFSN